MAFKSNISGIIAKQLGNLQGKLVAQIEGRVSDTLTKFSNECPTSSELQKIINTRNNLLAALNSFERRIASFNGTVAGMQGAVSSAKVVIQVIKSIPIPTAIIPPMSGGIGIPISILTRYSDALILLNKIVEVLENDIDGVRAVTGSVSSTIASLKNRLKTIDIAIETCSKKQPADLAQILATAQPPENTGSEGTPDADYLYKGYVLAIIEDPNSPKIAPRRYAVAKDKGGTIRLRGESSFSSDTQVLLDEIKFKIDNQFT
jgi:hypothetical protein